MQAVKIEDSLSEPLPLKAGVPQGSILGPVLFTLYVNDLLQVPKHCRALGYMDDTKVFMALPSSQLPEAVAARIKHLVRILARQQPSFRSFYGISYCLKQMVSIVRKTKNHRRVASSPSAKFKYLRK